MDYIVIGSIGFAQVGQDGYDVKRKIENSVLREIVRLENIFVIPKIFKDCSVITIKTFQHDFGSYDELCLVYNYNKVEEFSEETKEKFHDWIADMESYDFEQPTILKYCGLKENNEECSLYLKKEGNNQVLIIKYH